MCEYPSVRVEVTKEKHELIDRKIKERKTKNNCNCMWEKKGEQSLYRNTSQRNPGKKEKSGNEEPWQWHGKGWRQLKYWQREMLVEKARCVSQTLDKAQQKANMDEAGQRHTARQRWGYFAIENRRSPTGLHTSAASLCSGKSCNSFWLHQTHETHQNRLKVSNIKKANVFTPINC